MTRLSLRWRLTLWYGTVLASMVAALGGVVYLLMKRELLNRTDWTLAAHAGMVQEQLAGVRSRDELAGRLSPQLLRHPAFDLRVIDAAGAELGRSDPFQDRGLPTPSPWPEPGQDVYESVRTPGRRRARVLSRVLDSGAGPALLQVAVPLDRSDRQLAELMLLLLLGGPLAVGSALGCGYLLARQALAPVDRMVATADEITATRLDRRIEVANPDDELGRLARTLNGMIGRLERSFEEVRRFTADAAHELRTPLAILRNEAEVALRVPRDSEQYRDCLENMLEEIDHLARLSEALLLLFRGDAGLGANRREPLEIHSVVEEIAEHIRVVATDHQQDLAVEACSPCRVTGNPEQLRRLVFNLLDNAVKFTPAGGRIEVRVGGAGGRVQIVVSDTGIGIAPEHLPRVFDRFYRVDSARSRRTGGNGLGLSICRSIVEAHQGTIELASEPGRGTVVTVNLPCSPGAHSQAPRHEPAGATA
ncbi:Sensor kinase CusS [Aquisphaera giovannonii]|uniref:histidine kinase n=1 Tax=Aquisphaera giovannonii TaxID=406548 RepID=A0A5B9W1D6_9BACT|nr:heavy metal sensor histidine kinase [Aquisphaera giovannonii]QEH34462.1 Sensor kinase CusS [Aquisphaera giovannonii]